MTSQELLHHINSVLEEEGVQQNESLTSQEKLEKYILPSLEQSKNTLASLYKFQPKHQKGLIGRLKSFVLNKFKNITINVVERETMRQQKFNELVYQALVILAEEKGSER